jgi:chromosome segregation ATPase
VQVQIDEAQQAFDAVEKQQQRTLNQHKDLTTKLTNNEQEKIRLEKQLENNKLENASLKIRIEQNKKAQDSLANVSVQVQKVLEQHKEKQKKIN